MNSRADGDINDKLICEEKMKTIKKVITCGILFVSLFFWINCSDSETLLFEENFDVQGDWKLTAFPESASSATIDNGKLSLNAVSLNSNPEGTANSILTIANPIALSSSSNLRVEFDITGISYDGGGGSGNQIILKVHYGSLQASIDFECINDVGGVPEHTNIVLTFGSSPSLSLDGQIKDFLQPCFSPTTTTEGYDLEFDVSSGTAENTTSLEINSIKISAL